MSQSARTFRSKRTPTAERVPFTFVVHRDGEEESHDFQAVPVTDTASLSALMINAQRKPEEAMAGMLRMIGKMLDNKDGTPANWAPVQLPPPPSDSPVWPDGDPEGEGAPVRKFRGPDGALYPMHEAERFSAFEAGSSRRRWRYLMEQDDEVIVDSEALAELFEWLVGLAANRPTRPSS